MLKTIYTIVEFFIHMYQHKGTLRQKLFVWRVEREIYHRMFPHLEKEQDCGYPFNTAAQMNAQTQTHAVASSFEHIEQQIRRMPGAYGECFRHIMHRDLRGRLQMYERLAQRRIQPAACDPRFVATRA